MTSERNSGGLELEAVVSGFSEAQKTLASLGEELQQISKIGAEQQETKAALIEATKEIAEFARNAGVQLTGLADAQSQTEAVLKAGAELLSGSQLAEVTSKVETLSVSLDAMRDELSTGRQVANETHEQLVTKLAESNELFISKLDEVAKSLSRVDDRVSRSIFGRIF
jgi:uncharacterized phage infection (PIP) family protein YhgE